MNKATAKLSLRKLLIATMALGPLATLPAPLWALPTTSQYTVTNGSASLATGTGTATFTVSDRTVLNWLAGSANAGNFTIPAGETWSFQGLSSTGAVLNKVGYNGFIDTATINGNLISSGKVFILANGTITVGAGAQINTAGGLVLSTLLEPNDFAFTTGGNLAFTGSSTGTVSIQGNATNAASVVAGNLSVYAGTITLNNVTVAGDALFNQTTGGLALTGTGGTTVNGNLTVVTNNGAITQGTGAISAGNTTLNTNGSGAGVGITLSTATNTFGTLTINDVGTSASTAITAANTGNVILNASTIGKDLSITAAGNITTAGAVVVGANSTAPAGNVVFTSGTAGNITFNNGSSVTGFFNATAAAGNITANVNGNLTTGTITSTTAAKVVSLTSNATVSLNGTIGAAGGNVNVSGSNITGNSSGVISSTAANANFTTTGGSLQLPVVTATNVTATSNGGAISEVGIITVGNTTTNGTLTANAGTGNISLTGLNVITGVATNATTASNDLVVLTGNVVSLTNTANTTLGNTSVAGNLTVSTNSSAFGAGTVALGNGQGTLAPVISVGGALNITTNGSNVFDDTASQTSVFGTVTINTAAAGFGALANNIVINSNGSGFFQPNATVSITGNAAGGANATATATSNVQVTTNATSTTVNVAGNTGITAVNVTNGGGGFNTGTNAPVITITGGGNNTNAGAAVPTANYDNSSGVVTNVTFTSGTAGYQTAPTVVFSGGGGTGAAATAVINTATGALLAINITNPGGNYTSAPTVTLIGGNNTSGVVQPTLTYSIIPAGSVSLTAATGQGKGSYGQFNITAGSVTLAENTAVNLGNITAGSVSANSTASDIVVSGNVNVINGGALSLRASSGNVVETTGVLSLTGAATFNSSNTFGTNLSNTSNSFGGAVTVTNGGNDIIVSGSSFTLGNGTSVTSGNLAITTVGSTSNNVTIAGGNLTNLTVTSGGNINFSGNNTAFRNVTLNASDTTATAITGNSGALTINGTLTLTSAGGAVFGNVSNNMSTVVLNGIAGTTTITNSRNLTVSGNSSGAVNLNAGTGNGAFPSAWQITLGNLNVNSLTANVLNGSGNSTGTTVNANIAGNGASGNISQSAGSILHVENALTATTFGGGNIVLGNNGNSAGRIQLSTGGAVGTAGAGNITYSEDSGVKVGNLATNGTATITSRFSSIVEDASGTATTFNVAGTSSLLSLNAPNGGITLGGTTSGSATTGVVQAVTMNTSGGAALITTATGNVAIGAVNANSLTISAPNANITQTAPLNIFGTANISAGNATAGGNITLTNTSNNFGPVILTSNSQVGHDVSVTESGTLNLRTVNMAGSTAGNFTATSVNGDIISTGFGGVKPGGTIASPGSGVVTLAATNGNITVGDATTDFPTSAGVVFNAKNVSLTVLGGTSGSTPIVLGANGTSSVAGNLTVTSATGSILNAGNVVVSGNAVFTSGTGNIVLSQTGDQFGTLKFVGNQVSIAQQGDMKLLTGSSALGAAALASGGNITVVNVGGSISFGSTVSLTAVGNITLPKLIQAANTLTVNAAGTKDLSALSVSGDLGGKSPVNLGTGAYSGPQP